MAARGRSIATYRTVSYAGRNIPADAGVFGDMERFFRLSSLLAAAAFGLVLAAACIDDDGSTGSRPNESYPTKVVDAPIDAVDIVVRESMPPQYAVVITSGLPNGCARFAGWEMVARTESEIVIRVTNRVPDSDEVACTMVYGTHESTAELGSDFVSGREYTVVVNDVRKTFTAQ